MPQRSIKILCPKDPDFYTPLALKTAQKGQHLPALVVYKNQSPIEGVFRVFLPIRVSPLHVSPLHPSDYLQAVLSVLTQVYSGTKKEPKPKL